MPKLYANFKILAACATYVPTIIAEAHCLAKQVNIIYCEMILMQPYPVHY